MQTLTDQTRTEQTLTEQTLTEQTLTEPEELEAREGDLSRDMLSILGANLIHYYRAARLGLPRTPVRPAPMVAAADLAPPALTAPSVRTQRRWAAAALVASVLFALAVNFFGLAVNQAGSGSSRTASPALPYALNARDRYTSLVARAQVARLPVFEEPSAAVEPTRVMDHPTRGGQPLVFLVVDDTREDWLRVQLPVRPNGSTGWVRRDDVTLSATRYRVQVALGRHRLEVYDGPELVFNVPVGIGTRDTPTPGGRFFLKELVEPPTDDTVYGNYVFGLSGYSEVLETFNGGEGVIGIHGTNQPSSIGRDVSGGCIRLRNEDMEKLVGRLPLGTPVDIVA